MKKILIVLAVLSAYVSASSTTNQQDVINVPLQTENPDENGPRSGLGCPISCFVVRPSSELFISSASVTDYATVYVENTTSGDFASENVAIGAFPSSVFLFGPGDYVIEITLSSGAGYHGSFAL